MDVIERAKAARGLVVPGSTWAVRGCIAMYEVIPDLIAEIERLREELLVAADYYFFDDGGY